MFKYTTSKMWNGKPIYYTSKVDYSGTVVVRRYFFFNFIETGRRQTEMCFEFIYN